jgi:hypothetical protein
MMTSFCIILQNDQYNADKILIFINNFWHNYAKKRGLIIQRTSFICLYVFGKRFWQTLYIFYSNLLQNWNIYY